MKHLPLISCAAVLTASLMPVGTPFAIAATAAITSTPATSASCTSRVLQFNTQPKYDTCVAQAQRLLKTRGIPDVSVDGKFGPGTVNNVLNFQREQALPETGNVGPLTWARLARPRAVSKKLPSSCSRKGYTILCVSAAQRKLFVVKNGKAVRIVKIRLGGFTRDKNGTWGMHLTEKGTFVLRAKANPKWSKPYKVSMPYALMYNPAEGEYVHQNVDRTTSWYSRSSHGCVNVFSPVDAKWLYANSPLNKTIVKVY